MPEPTKDHGLGVEERAVEAIQLIEEETAKLYNKLEVEEKPIVNGYSKDLILQIKEDEFLSLGLDKNLLVLLYENNPEGNFHFQIFRSDRGVYRHFFQIHNVNTGVGLGDSSRKEPFLGTTFAPDDSCSDSHKEAYNFLKELRESKPRAVDEGLKNVIALLQAAVSASGQIPRRR